MKVLFDAIHARWLAQGKLGLTDLYTVEAPALSTEDGDGGSVYPYGTVSTNIVADDPGFGEEGEDCLIMFALFSETISHVEVCASFELFKAAFDKHNLAITGYGTIILMRAGANLIRVDKIWQYAITYRLLIQKE